MEFEEAATGIGLLIEAAAFITLAFTPAIAVLWLAWVIHG